MDSRRQPENEINHFQAAFLREHEYITALMPMLFRLPLLIRIGGQIFRVKQIHRLRANLLPCALENTQPAINLGFARAQRHP